jgi:DNA-binding response OmpR family regulator
MRLLYAEDEEAMAQAVADILEYHKYQVDVVSRGDEALDYALAAPYDGIILDIMMPGMSGLEVLSSLRKKGCTTPVLLLTAKNEVEDRIEGLDLGADDYLAKPFAMGELLARVRAMLRRRDEFRPDIKTFGDVSLNPHSYELSRGEKSVVLPKLEYQMMEVLIINRGIYLSSEDLLEKVWGYDSEADIGSVWVYISYLRKRLSGLGSRVTIRAKRNIGYRLEE